MKKNKVLYILLCFVVIGLIAGCGNNGGAQGRNTNQQNGVEEALQAGIAEAEQSSGAEEEKTDASADEGKQSESSETEDPGSTDGIDVDLTKLSSTMVYSEVFSMMSEPEKYLGKTVKMEGDFTTYHDENTGQDYFACIIQDATACCAQGIEFVLTDDYSYPEDYPQVGETVSVTGVFDTYMEGEYRYCTLRNASLN